LASTAIFCLRRLLSILDILLCQRVEIVFVYRNFFDFDAIDFFQMTAK